jgi:redox-sensitive bicupin YhaK (pirin superfamily)
VTPAIAHLYGPHVRDLGDFTVRRLLPGHPLKTVGPFVFFDHMGPARFAPGTGIDVRPHPHIGLATVTYLYEGAILHRDSLGVVQRIEPGDVNWMIAGAGIVHSERTPADLRAAGSPLHGIQAWIALPRSHEQAAPAFEHHPKASLPVLETPGVQLRLIAGRGFGLAAPATTWSPMVYAAVEMNAGAGLAFPSEHAERAVYVAHGDASVGGDPVPEGRLALLAPGTTVRIEARSAATLMLLGGAPLDGERHLWWNFVASDRASIEAAKQRWRAGGFAPVPGEADSIPLPD